jgi:thiamine biosynthesis protein ThiS
VSISIRLNGDAREVEEGLTVAGLLEQLGIRAQRVVVEQNMRILRADDFAAARIAEGDELEVLQFVGGG